MTNNSRSVVLLVALGIGLPSFLLQLRERINRARRKSRHPAEKVAADRKAFEGRILHPDWVFYERHLQRPAPAALRELYSDRALILSPGLNYPNKECISTFGVLDEQELLDTRACLGFDVVAIATTEIGDPIYLRPGRSEADIVYVTQHDGGDTGVFAESVAVMLERLRQANRAD